MGLATYAIIETGKTVVDGTQEKTVWGILHDGNVEGEYESKTSAFESAVAAAGVAVREGHEVHVTVLSHNSGNGTARGGPTN